jgi:hypothetical protein
MIRRVSYDLFLYPLANDTLFRRCAHSTCPRNARLLALGSDCPPAAGQPQKPSWDRQISPQPIYSTSFCYICCENCVYLTNATNQVRARGAGKAYSAKKQHGVRRRRTVSQFFILAVQLAILPLIISYASNLSDHHLQGIVRNLKYSREYGENPFRKANTIQDFCNFDQKRILISALRRTMDTAAKT